LLLLAEKIQRLDSSRLVVPREGPTTVRMSFLSL